MEPITSQIYAFESFYGLSCWFVYTELLNSSIVPAQLGLVDDLKLLQILFLVFPFE